MTWDWDEHGVPSLPWVPEGIGGYDGWKLEAPGHETDETCPTCGGYGEIETGPDRRVTCDGDCGGIPMKGKKRCWPCRGAGKVPRTEEVLASGVYVTVDVDCPKCRGSGRS